jgi:hypothetical protein
MSLLALSILAGVVGAALIAFLVVRFALRMMWKLAMVAVLVTVVIVGVAGAYLYLEGSQIDLPALPGR